MSHHSLRRRLPSSLVLHLTTLVLRQGVLEDLELLEGEQLIVRPCPVVVLPLGAAQMVVTSYQIAFLVDGVAAGAGREPHRRIISLPLQTIAKVDIDGSSLILASKDLRVYRVKIEAVQADASQPGGLASPRDVESRCRRVYHTLMRRIYTNDMRKIFAFDQQREIERKHKEGTESSGDATAASMPSLRNLLDGWSVYDPRKEMARLGISNSQAFRVSAVNTKYQYSQTYPKLIVVPASICDKTLLSVAKFRSKARVPTITWRSPRTSAIISRSAQPLVGITRSRSKDDEDLVKALSECQPDKAATFYVIDARPRANAVGNQAMGKGFEDSSNYAGSETLFMGIGNIHVMRRALGKLQSAIARPDDGDAADAMYIQAEKGWLVHIRTLLNATNLICEIVENEGASCLIHCSDGWDRTSQLSAIAQLQLDPFYRTIEGFACLIEKEWLSFGHKFSDRCGHGGVKKADQLSPVFLQFLDCVWQITQQFPSAFEFNTELLVFIMDHVFSGRFGTFLFNCDRERQAANVRATESIWSYVMANREQFENPLYSHQQSRGVILTPVASLRVIRIWSDYFFRWSDNLTPVMAVPKRQPSRRLEGALRLTSSGSGDTFSAVPHNRFSMAIDPRGDPEDDLRDEVAEMALEDAESEDDDQDSELEIDPEDEEDGNTHDERPVWIKDKAVKSCLECNKKFTVIRRRHHCRHCGSCVCSSCSASRIEIPRLGYKRGVRVCNSCFVIIWNEKLAEDGNVVE